MASRICKLKWCNKHQRWEGRLGEQALNFNTASEAKGFAQRWDVAFELRSDVPADRLAVWNEVMSRE